MDIPIEAIVFDKPREDEQASIATTSTTRHVYGRAHIVRVPPQPSKNGRRRRVFYTLSKSQFNIIITLVSLFGALFLAMVVKGITDLIHHIEGSQKHVLENGVFTNGTTWELVQVGGGCRSCIVSGNGLGGMLLGLGVLVSLL
jgi:hypothetical protein